LNEWVTLINPTDQTKRPLLRFLRYKGAIYIGKFEPHTMFAKEKILI